jgi:hypothetical protein
LAAGALATAVGTRETLLVAAAGGCLAVLWLLRSPLLRLRDLPEGEAEKGAGAAAGEAAGEDATAATEAVA